MNDAPVVDGRQCGECSMCCKLMEIEELGKPIGVWCAYVRKGNGCAIYSERPPSCAAFGCGYLHWPMAGEHWRPSKCKMVLVAEDMSRMAIHVDPSTPNVWKAQPYYSDLKTWAWHAAQYGFQQLVVVIGRRMIAVLPDRDIDLGIVEKDEVVLTGQLADGSYTARKLKASDPTLIGMEPGQVYTPASSGTSRSDP